MPDYQKLAKDFLASLNKAEMNQVRYGHALPYMAYLKFRKTLTNVDEKKLYKEIKALV